MSSDSYCKYCSRGPFIWRELEAGWRLFETKKKPHVCRRHPSWVRDAARHGIDVKAEEFRRAPEGPSEAPVPLEDYWEGRYPESLTLGKLCGFLERLVGADGSARALRVCYEDEQGVGPSEPKAHHDPEGGLLFESAPGVTVDQLLDVCTALHDAWIRSYKGGAYPMDGSTPIWSGLAHERGRPITGVEFQEGVGVLLRRA